MQGNIPIGRDNAINLCGYVNKLIEDDFLNPKKFTTKRMSINFTLTLRDKIKLIVFSRLEIR